jgi:uncharacterized protein YegL
MQGIGRPGGPLETIPLHFIWLCDCSGSMAENNKIGELNEAIRGAIPAMRAIAKENPSVQIYVRAIKFAEAAEWHVEKAERLNAFEWGDLRAGGRTALGSALQLVASVLNCPAMPPRALPPVLVLISDGNPTDDFESGLEKLEASDWGKKAVRIAISVEARDNMDVLEKFTGKNNLKPLRAANSNALVEFIKFCSTEVLKSASSAAVRPGVPHSFTRKIFCGDCGRTVDNPKTTKFCQNCGAAIELD